MKPGTFGHLGFVLIVLLSATACSHDDNVPSPSVTTDTPIGFVVADAEFPLTPAIRAADNSLTSISVFGYHTPTLWKDARGSAQPNLFNRQEVTYNGNEWIYHPPQMWMTIGYHHFFAFSPHNVITSIDDVPGEPHVIYQVSSSVADHTDLLWSWNGGTVATPVSLQNMQYNTISSTTINFLMRHALTKITLYANVGQAIDENRFKITEVVFENTVYEARSDFTISPNVDVVTGATWRYTELNKQRDIIASVTQPNAALDDVLLTRSVQPITTPGGHLYIMPQRVETTNAPKAITLRITLYDTYSDIELVVTTPLVSPDRTGFYPGQAINYTLTYNGEGNTPFAYSEQAINHTPTHNGGRNTPFAIQAIPTSWDEKEMPIISSDTHFDEAKTLQ